MIIHDGLLLAANLRKLKLRSIELFLHLLLLRLALLLGFRQSRPQFFHPLAKLCLFPFCHPLLQLHLLLQLLQNSTGEI
jgi:hypothetical protein